MKKKIITLFLITVLLIPIAVKAKGEIPIPFDGLLFHNYDINLTSDVHEYYVTVENNTTKLSIANLNKCAEDELCINDNLFDFFLRYTDDFTFNNKQIYSYGSITFSDGYDEETEDKNDPLKYCTIYKIDGKTRKTICDVYNSDNVSLYVEITVYDENDKIIGYVKRDSDDEYIDSHYYIGDLNVGENILSFVNKDENDVYIIHITRKDKEEVVPTEEVKEDNTIKEEENIKESPKTGSTINIIIGIVLLITFGILLYLNREHKQTK